MIRVKRSDALTFLSTDAAWTIRQVGSDRVVSVDSAAIKAALQESNGKMLFGAGKLVVWLDEVTWAERSIQGGK